MGGFARVSAQFFKILVLFTLKKTTFLCLGPQFLRKGPFVIIPGFA